MSRVSELERQVRDLRVLVQILQAEVGALNRYPPIETVNAKVVCLSTQVKALSEQVSKMDSQRQPMTVHVQISKEAEE